MRNWENVVEWRQSRASQRMEGDGCVCRGVVLYDVPERWTGEVYEERIWQINSCVRVHILFFRIPCSLAVWWTVGVGPEGCTLPWTTLRHAVLFLISWHFCSSCLRLRPYMGIIQHSQCAISLNYICLLVAFTFHCEMNCVSMAAPLDYIMACITVPPPTSDYIVRSHRGKKCEAMLQTVPFSPGIVFVLKGYNQQA